MRLPQIVKYLPKKRILILLLAFYWSCELFIFQAETFVIEYDITPIKYFIASSIRFSLNLSFFIAIINLLHPFILYLLTVTSLLYYLIITSYCNYFNHAISYLNLKTQAIDFLNCISINLINIKFYHFIILSLGITVKILLIQRIGNHKTKNINKTLGFSGFICYLLIILLTNKFIDPLKKLKHFGSVDRMGITYGYIPVFFTEFFLVSNQSLLNDAIKQKKIKSDQLKDLVPHFKIPEKVVIIQVESLDYDLLGIKHDNTPVMPFLVKVAQEKGLSLKLKAIHKNGSAEADFILLTGEMPSTRIINYKLINYPYTNTTPKIVTKAGYKLSTFHGNFGKFFNRRNAFNKIGVSTAYFKEEFETLYNCKPYKWGIKDEDLFNVSAHLLNTNPAKEVHFIITLSSHTPFHYIEKINYKLIKDPQSKLDRYLNSMHYVDHCLETYINKIPENSLVIIYGDHESGLKSSYANSFDKTEFVPLIIYSKGTPPLPQQTIASTSEELNFLDMATFIRNLFFKII